MAEMQYPISVDELIGSYEVLEDIVTRRNIRAISSIATGAQSTFKQKWDRCRNQFSTFGAKRIDLLIDTVCRDLILHHIYSNEGRSLAEELSRIDQPSGPPINMDLPASGLTIGPSLVQSDETTFDTLCKGHEYDRFGVVIPHPEPLPCPPELIAAVCTTTRDQAIQCRFLTEVRNAFNNNWDESPKIKPYRLACNRPLETTTCHLHLKPRSFNPWIDSNKLVRNVHMLLRPSSIHWEYKFDRGKLVVSADNLLYKTVCVNSYKKCHVGGNPNWGYAGCSGQFEVCVYPNLNVVAFKSQHKHHYSPTPWCDDELILRKIERDAEIFMKDIVWSQGKSGTEEEALKLLKEKFPDVSLPGIQHLYNFILSKEEFFDDSEWLSIMKFHNTHSSKYTQFTFYSPGSIGYTVMFKDLIQMIDGANVPVAIHSTRIINKPGCEVVAAIAEVKGNEIPVGYILISPLDEVAKEILEAHPETTENGKSEKNKAERPLPQCEIAKMIESVCNSRFPTNPKLALISSFLLLLKGTELPLLVSDLGCRHLPLARICEPLHNIIVCPMAARIGPDHELYRKRIPKVNVSLFTCEKNITQVQALKFTYPDIFTGPGFSQVLKSLKPALGTIETQWHKFADFINQNQFPPVFMSLCPQMFDKDPHSAENCPYATGISKYKCWQCHPEFYDTWVEPKLSIPELRKNEIFPEMDSPENKECTYSKLVHMMIEHTAANPQIPQMFAYMSEMVPISKQAQFYSPDGLKVLILGDMLSFCLKFGILGVFRFLWTEWYSDKWFGMWTRCKTKFSKLLAWEPKLQIFESMFSTESHTLRLDKIICAQHRLIYAETSEVLNVTIHSFGKLNIDLPYSTTPQIFKDRRTFITDWLKNPEDHISRDQYKRDCEQFGTDVVMFVCGCDAYKKYDTCLCRHIMRGIDPDSFSSGIEDCPFNKVYPQISPPFYKYYKCDENVPLDSSTWKNLVFSGDYLQFWNAEGGHIVEGKGGRKWKFQPPAPYTETRKKESKDEKMRFQAYKKQQAREEMIYRQQIDRQIEQEIAQEEENDRLLVYRLTHRKRFAKRRYKYY